MKLLLDENVPRKLKFRLSRFQVFTVQEMGWAGLTNGILLAQMLEHRFEALVTFDRSMGHQQNFKEYPIPVLVLTAPSNTYEDIIPLLQGLLSMIEGGNLNPGLNTVSVTD